ncbi:MAG: prolyl oligopeptidase family serine peptidase [Pseudomonadota bacterium]
MCANAQQPVPADVLLLPPAASSFVLSPNAQWLVNVEHRGARYYLRFTDLQQMAEARTIDAGFYRPHDLTWANNDTLMYVVEGAIHRIDARTGADRRLLRRAFNKGKMLAEDWHIHRRINDVPNSIVIEAEIKGKQRRYTNLYRFDINTRALEQLTDGKRSGINDWRVDHAGQPVLGIRRTNADVTHFIPRNNKPGFERHSARHPDAIVTLDYRGSDYLSRRFAFADVSTSGDKLLVAENLSTGRFRIVEYSPQDDTLGNVIFSDAHYDAFDPLGPTTGQAILQSSKGQIVGVRYRRDRLGVHWLDPDIQALQETIDQRWPDNQNVLLGYSLNHGIAVFRSTDTARRGYVYIYRELEGTAQYIRHTRLTPHLDNYELPTTQTIRYRARDGYEIEGYLTLPTDSSSDTPPLVVLPHGEPFARSSADFDPQVLYLASRGYAVLEPNFRGSTGFGRDHLFAGIRELGGLMIDDITDAAIWAIETKLTNANAVYIMGSSYGGYAAMMSVLRYPDVYQGVIAHAAPFDLVRSIKRMKSAKAQLAYDYWTEFAGDIRKDKKQLIAASPYHLIESLEVPHLIFHGAKDANVDVEQSLRLEARMQALGMQPNVRIINNAGHNFGGLDDFSYSLELIVDQLDQWQLNNTETPK